MRRMHKLWRAILGYFHSNVQVDRVAGEWEPVSSTTGQVWRHRGCGELVREGMMDQHVKSRHGKRCGVTIRLYEDGTGDIEAAAGFLMSAMQAQLMREFNYDQMKLAVDMMDGASRKMEETMRRVLPFPVDRTVN